MPPRKRKKAAAAAAAAPDAPQVEVPHARLVEDDSSQQNSNADADREEKRKKKEELQVKRKEHLAQVDVLRAEGLQQMNAAGMRQQSTEAKGDCWLIALLAGQEITESIIGGVTNKQRMSLLTPWRTQLAEFAPHIDTKGLTMSGKVLGIEYLKRIAMYFGVSSEVIKACEVKNDWTEVRLGITKALDPWKLPRHYGTFQEPVHVCMGVILRKNILEIDLPSISQSGTCMLPALFACCAAQPRPHSC